VLLQTIGEAYVTAHFPQADLRAVLAS
jgi:hypothetical protein